MTQPSHKQRIIQHDSWPRLTMKLIDAAAIITGLMMLIIWIPAANSQSTIVIGLVAIGVFNISAEISGLYRNWRGIRFEREAVCCVIALVIALMLLSSLGHFSLYSTELSARHVILWFSFTTIISLATRILYRWYCYWSRAKGIHSRGYAVVGINDLGIHLVRNINTAPDLGLRFLGYYDDRPEERTGDLPQDISVKLGKIDTLVESAKSGAVQVVFISLPMRAEKRIRSLIQALADTTASVYIVPDLFVFQMLNARWTDIQGLPVVSVSENPLYGVDGILKRGVDIALGTLGIMAISLPMLGIAAAVKLTSRGPILFRQKRYGLDGKEILVLKFRSMNVLDDGDKVVQATKNDQRFTPIGGFLRRTSLDELPQIFNVISGKMSLVGPRPHANAHNEFYRSQIEGYMLRHKVKPGITGLAQVNGCRGETETLDKMEKRVFFDHQYIREWSIWLDLKIILQTFTVVFSKQNAH